MKDKQLPSILQVDEVLISSDLLTERFCCDLNICKGKCCIEGDAGAPVTLDEVAAIEEALDIVWLDMAASAQSVVDRQGVAYVDQEGDLVTSIVNGKDCVFTCYDTLDVGEGPIPHCCLCSLEKAFRAGRLTGLNYNRWDVCQCAREKGAQLDIPVYRFLKDPLIRRFGAQWYAHLEEMVGELKEQGYL